MVSVSTQLEAVRLNAKCTVQLIESLVDMVSNLTKEVTHLKSDNVLLKQAIKNLHSIIEASPKLSSQYIPREQGILPPEMSHKDAASIQLVPTATPSTHAVPIPAGTTLTELSYRDVAATGISPSRPTALPDPDGFKTVTYRRKAASSTPPAEISLNQVLAAPYHCLSSQNLKDPRHCLSLDLAPKSLLMTYTKH
jgi:hypothetical protein